MTTRLPGDRAAQSMVRRLRTARPEVRRFTRAEYYRMAEAGLFEGEHVELVNGKIVCISRQGSKHSLAVTLITRLLVSTFGPEFAVRVQLPLALTKRSEVEPDFAILRGDPRLFADEHPSTADRVIEVAESSLAYDRTTKASLYAKAGVTEYWIVDLVNGQLEVRRDPKLMTQPKRKHLHTYSRLYAPDESVSPLIAPSLELSVRELLP